MPTSVKQMTAKPVQTNGTPLGQPGSILSRAVAVDSVKEDFQKFVLYGFNRVGKTTLACQWEKPLLLISFEPGAAGGAVSVKKVPEVTYLRLTSKDDAMKLAAELRVQNPFKTHVIDTVTSMQDIILKEITGRDDVILQQNFGDVSTDEYRMRAERCKEVMRAFCVLPCHTVFVAQEKDHNPIKDLSNKLTKGVGHESFIAADLGGATVKWLQDQCSFIARLSVEKETKLVEGFNTVLGKQIPFSNLTETGRMIRRLRTLLHTNFAAGFRSCTPDAVPEYIECLTPQEMHAEVQLVIAGQRSSKGKYPSESV